MILHNTASLKADAGQTEHFINPFLLPLITCKETIW